MTQTCCPLFVLESGWRGNELNSCHYSILPHNHCQTLKEKDFNHHVFTGYFHEHIPTKQNTIKRSNHKIVTSINGSNRWSGRQSHLVVLCRPLQAGPLFFLVHLAHDAVQFLPGLLVPLGLGLLLLVLLAQELLVLGVLRLVLFLCLVVVDCSQRVEQSCHLKTERWTQPRVRRNKSTSAMDFLAIGADGCWAQAALTFFSCGSLMTGVLLRSLGVFPGARCRFSLLLKGRAFWSSLGIWSVLNRLGARTTGWRNKKMHFTVLRRIKNKQEKCSYKHNGSCTVSLTTK